MFNVHRLSLTKVYHWNLKSVPVQIETRMPFYCRISTYLNTISTTKNTFSSNFSLFLLIEVASLAQVRLNLSIFKWRFSDLSTFDFWRQKGELRGCWGCKNGNNMCMTSKICPFVIKAFKVVLNLEIRDGSNLSV